MKVLCYKYYIMLGVSALASLLTFSYLSLKGSVVLLSWEIIPLEGMSHSMSFILDSMSMKLIVLVLVVTMSVLLFTSDYMESEKASLLFLSTLMLFVLSMVFLSVAGSTWMLFLGWDGLGVTSFVLINFYSSNYSVYCSMYTLLINRFGDMMLMFSFSALVLCLGYSDWSTKITMSGATSVTMLLVLASWTKSAIFPFGSWLPLAMAAPTPVSALVHSSTLVVAGVVLLSRIMCVSAPTSGVSTLILTGGVVTSLLGGIYAFNEYDVKKLIAYSTMSQTGLMMSILGLGNCFLAMDHLANHAVFKSLIFMLGGCTMMKWCGEQDIRQCLGAVNQSPLLVLLFLITTLNLAGIPFLAGYMAKHSAMELCFSGPHNLLLICGFLVSVGLSMAYSLRLYYYVISAQPSMSTSLMSGTHTNFLMTGPLVLLSVMSTQAALSDFNSVHWLPMSGRVVAISTLICLFVGFTLLLYKKYYQQNNDVWAARLWSHLDLSTLATGLFHKLTRDSTQTMTAWVEPKVMLSSAMMQVLLVPTMKFSSNLFNVSSMFMLSALIISLTLLLL